MKKPDSKPTGGYLRQRAEIILKEKAGSHGISDTDADILKLIHELEVHQIELELQNEELELAIKKADQISLKYTGLYDFSPTVWR